MSFGESFADRYVSGGGTVDFRRLGSDFAGAIVLTIGSVYSGIILYIGDAIQSLLLGTAGFNAELVGAIFGTPGRLIASAVGSTVGFVSGFGLLGYAAAVALVLVAYFLIAEVLPDG